MSFFEFYREEEFNLTAKDGVSLYCKVYTPHKSPSGRVMVIHHGFGEHLGRYANLVETMEVLNYTLYFFDFRGHGQSGGKRGHAKSYHQLLLDLDLVVNTAIARERVEKVVLFGHSMGAVISALYAENEIWQKKLAALVLSSLAIRHRLDWAMKLKKVAAAVFSRLLPAVTVTSGLDARLISHDDTVVDAYMRDPLVHGMLSFYLGNFLINSEKLVINNAWKVKIPLYMFHGKSDGIAIYQGSEIFYDLAASPDKKLNLYEGLFHETLNEFPLNRQQVERDLIDWLKKISK